MTPPIRVKKPNRKSSKPQSITTLRKRSSGLRISILVFTLGLLYTIFLWNGGAISLVNAMTRSALASKRLDAASGWLQWAKRISPNNAEAEFLRGRAARKKGQLEQMAEHLQLANKFGYDKLKLQREQDLALAFGGRLDDGVEERLQTWLQESPAETNEIIEAYANGLTALSRFEDAMKLLIAWEEASPAEPLANYRKARIHEHLHQTDEAEKEYRKAIAKDASFLKASYHLGRVLLQLRHPEESMKYFQACDSGTASLAAKTGIAGCYRTLGDLEKARAILREVVQSSDDELLASFRSVDETPERSVAKSDLGGIETELGEFSEARKVLEMALDKYPLDSIARYSYAVALRGLGLQEEAEANFEQTRAARAALDQVSELQEVLRKNPYDTESRIRIGKIVLTYESERTGVFWIQSIFAYDPDNEEAHQLLAEYYEAKKNPSSDDTKMAAYHRSFLAKH